mmetsp:Transcript_15864/g.18253  ORF Transcript_15864/g.18253 Transcript_15864/m.18253 type:complete len:176 (+) Transcript_15864:132-659(+)
MNPLKPENRLIDDLTSRADLTSTPLSPVNVLKQTPVEAPQANVRRRFPRRNSVVKTMLSESVISMIPSQYPVVNSYPLPCETKDENQDVEPLPKTLKRTLYHAKSGNVQADNFSDDTASAADEDSTVPCHGEKGDAMFSSKRRRIFYELSAPQEQEQIAAAEVSFQSSNLFASCA